MGLPVHSCVHAECPLLIRDERWGNLTAGFETLLYEVVDILGTNIQAILDVLPKFKKPLTEALPCQEIYQVLILHPSSMGKLSAPLVCDRLSQLHSQWL